MIIGFVGLGEAGSAIAAGLADNGATVIAYDVRATEADFDRDAVPSGIRLTATSEDLVAEADIVIVLTSATSAEPIARGLAGRLRPEQVYADWNSAGPAVKRRIGELLAGRGVPFADGAVMSTVPGNGIGVPVLASGPGAAASASALNELGARIEVIEGPPGSSSAVKMFRSLLVKGIEALLVEMALGAESFGVTDRVLDSLTGSLPFDDWSRLGPYLLTRTIGHGTRRAAELREVADTLRDAQVEPLLAEAGVARLESVAALGLASIPGEEYHQTLARIVDELRAHT